VSACARCTVTKKREGREEGKREIEDMGKEWDRRGERKEREIGDSEKKREKKKEGEREEWLE
jgi:hypothetical protein